MLIKKNKSLRHALKKMSSEGKKCLLVINEMDEFLGTLSDGDIRKALLEGKNLKTNINELYNQKSTFFTENNFDDKAA